MGNNHRVEQTTIWDLLELEEKDRKQKVKDISELDRLFYEIHTYRSSKKYLELLEFIKKFPNIAPFNAMLINIQKPGSVYVASAYEWRNIFNRTIKLGARPLVILRPFGPVAFVFELNDTEGYDPFPKELLNPFKAKGELENHTWELLQKNLKSYGIRYDEVDFGTNMAGIVALKNTNKDEIIVRNNKRYKIKIIYEIVVNKNHPKETKFATVLHELGHLFCGHIGSPYKKWWKERTMLSKNEKEFEAESICWLVCERLNIHNPSAEYLSNYVDKNNKIPNVSIDTILKSTNMIENMLRSTIAIKKEITAKFTE